MAANKYALIRYRIIDKCISNKYKPYPNMQALQSACEDSLYGSSNGSNVSVTTIEKDLWAMRNENELGYNAPIKYSRSHQGYYYTDPDYSINSIPLKGDDLDAIKFAALTLHQFKDVDVFKQFGSAINKIFDRLNISNTVNDTAINDFVQFETQPTIKGSEHLGILLDAIKNKFIITIKYNSFTANNSKTYNLHPYLLKEYRNRWYLIALNPIKNKVQTFGLDRFDQKPELLDETFSTDEVFSSADYFKNSIGITASKEKPQKITLSFKPLQGSYIKTQPIHSSQVIVKDTATELRIELLLTTTPELIMTLLSFGNSVTVIKPAILKQKVLDSLKTAINNY